MKKEKKGFSLVELLIVIGSLGALIGIITSVLKPVELFKNSRDIQRINDLNKISAALKEYIALSKNPDLDGPYYDSSGYDEPSSTVFISVPLDVEPTSTNFFIDKNGKAWIINQVKSKNLYKINGEGWIPVNLSEIKYSGLTSYPVDPINSLSKNFFYSYVFKRDIRSFELNANLESTKYRYNGEQDKTSTDGGDDPYIYEVGSTLTILPSEKIYNTERITGLQPKIEISVFDVSINVYIGQTTTTYITVYNNGSTTLTIYNITQKPAKKRIDVDKNYITINPGLKEDLGIICNAKGFNQATVITTTLQLWNNDEANNPKNINITCNIINPPRIYFEPYPINIEAKANQVVTTTFKINNLGGDVLIISSTTMSIGDSEEPCPSWITFSLSAPPPININPNSYITVFVTTSAPASMHNFECRYVIYSNDPLRPASNESINIKVISASEGPTLYAKSGNKEAYLWWELKETGGSPILYYEIFRKTETTEFSKIASVTSTFYTDTGLTNGIKYSYEVRAVNTVGEGYFSNVVSVIPTGTSSPPLNLTATSTNNGICYTGYIRLNWDAPTESGGLPIIKYNIYNSSTESLIGTTTKTTFLVKTTSGYEYSFYVTAVNSAGESDKSNIATTTSYSRPCSPKNLIASATTSSINLTWQSPDYNGGLNINYYNIYMTTSTTWNLIASSTQTNYSYTNVATNTYYFYVTAINSLGEGEASNIASTKWPPTAQPLSPSNLTATPTTTPANRIILNWSSSPTLGIQEYRIYRKSETSYVKIATTSPSILTYPDYNIQKGITYYYYVTAFKNDLESNPSNIASATLITAPSAPLNLEVGICSLNKVNLGWNEPYDKGGVSIIQYNIYRTTSTAYIKIGTTTNLFYSDYSPVKNFINYYYVTAQNIKGEGPSSNIASCNLGGGNCFAKTYGTANYEYLYSLEKTSDGGYVITGATTNYILILKLDSSGNIEWQKSYQYPNPLPTSIKETNDNGYILTGRSNNYDLQQTIVLKLKGNGDVEWAKRYNIISNWPQIIEIEDGYVLSGATYNSCPGYSGMGYFASIVKLDLSGNIQWAKYYCLSPSFSFEIKQKTSDGGYIAITRGSKYIIKLSQTGDIQWLKTYYPNSGSIGFMDITQTNDGYIVSGYYYSDTTYQDILILKLDSNGNIQWYKIYGGNGHDIPYEIEKTSDGGYVISGYTKSYGAGDGDIFLLKIDSNGNIQFQKTYGGIGDEVSYGLEQTYDGGYILGGITPSFGKGSFDIFLIKTDSNGNIVFKNGPIMQNINLSEITTTINREFLTTPGNYSFAPYIYDITSQLSTLTSSLTSISYGDSCTSGPTPPSPPRNLQASPGNQQISLTWEAPLSDGGSSILGYKVYRNGNQIATTTNLSYTDTGLTNGTEYCYYIKAYNSIGDSDKSNTACATPKAELTPPSPPRNLQASPGNQQISLTWEAPLSDGGSSILGYKVYRNGNQIATTTNLSYTDTGLTNGTEYCYYIKAYNSIGDSDKSNTTCEIPSINVPNTPSNLTATPGLIKISLSWNAPSQPPAVSGYYLYRSYYQDYNYSKIASTTNTSYEDINLNSGVKYYYYVTAYNEAGESSKSNIASATPYGVPTPPQNLNLTIGDKVMNLSWQAPLSDGGSPITEYRIYRKKSSGSYSLLSTTSPSTLSYSDNNVTLGTTYYYKVRAKNIYGESNDSNEVSGKAGTIPSCPRNLVLESYSNYIKIKWDKPSSDGYYNIENYEIWRKTGVSGTYILLATTTNLYYNDYNVSSGLNYYYKVLAKNKIGTSQNCSEISGSTGGGEITTKISGASKVVFEELTGIYKITYPEISIEFSNTQYVDRLSIDALWISNLPIYVWCDKTYLGPTYVSNSPFDIPIKSSCKIIILTASYYYLPPTPYNWYDITTCMTDGSKNTSCWSLDGYAFSCPPQEGPCTVYQVLRAFNIAEIRVYK